MPEGFLKKGPIQRPSVKPTGMPFSQPTGEFQGREEALADSSAVVPQPVTINKETKASEERITRARVFIGWKVSV